MTPTEVVRAATTGDLSDEDGNREELTLRAAGWLWELLGMDLLPSSTEWGPIYFACHDAPKTIVRRFGDLRIFAYRKPPGRLRGLFR